ncbi:hypothetical protein MNBD_DELTA04-1475 [hydrothermal vent metagenome]|uniref:Uncharacterized protein n=1 Tax=hydrothermal vent metagenome TaxID=652676 RepID=A0A3B0VGL3_9ZZZZ
MISKIILESVIDRPAVRSGEDQQMRLFVNNAINSTYCLEYYLKPLRIQDNNKSKWGAIGMTHSKRWPGSS